MNPSILDHASEATADKDTWLGVHELTEFVYCPRGGLVAHAQRSKDSGEESEREPWASLSYVPPYDLEEISARIENKKKSLKVFLLLSLVAVALSVISYFRLGVAWLLVALPAYLLCLHTLAQLLALADLVWLKWNVSTETGPVPDASRMEDQRVNWWAMVRGGYDSVPFAEDRWMRSDSLQLAGRPWRMLRRGSIRIPVFMKRCRNSPKAHVLHPQHYVRITAYCRLIEESEGPGAESPYGIVLFDDSYDGWAIHAGGVIRDKALTKALAEARHTIQSAECGHNPDVPDSSLCSGCPVGKPVVHQMGQTETLRRGIPLPVFAAKGRGPHTFHSPCGDFFNWLPPHERVREKGLVAISISKAAEPEKKPG